MQCWHVCQTVWNEKKHKFGIVWMHNLTESTQTTVLWGHSTFVNIIVNVFLKLNKVKRPLLGPTDYVIRTTIGANSASKNRSTSLQIKGVCGDNKHGVSLLPSSILQVCSWANSSTQPFFLRGCIRLGFLFFDELMKLPDLPIFV